jgi:hypothetical protein
MAFFKTSCFFQTKLPSPSEITASAKNSYNFSGRTFPNKKGLDLFQIGNAIDSVGLEFELRNNIKVNNPGHVKAFIYSYLKLGIPVLLGISFSQNNEELHLITLTGFKYNSRNKKIRISYEDVLSQIEGFDPLFRKWFGKSIEYKWDLYIASSNKYKEEVSNNDDLNSYFKERILFNQLPKYIWVARLMIEDAIVMELLFDSTDVSDGDFCILISCYDSLVRELFGQQIENKGFVDYWRSTLNEHYVSLLADATQ